MIKHEYNSLYFCLEDFLVAEDGIHHLSVGCPPGRSSRHWSFNKSEQCMKPLVYNNSHFGWSAGPHLKRDLHVNTCTHHKGGIYVKVVELRNPGRLLHRSCDTTVTRYIFYCPLLTSSFLTEVRSRINKNIACPCLWCSNVEKWCELAQLKPDGSWYSETHLQGTPGYPRDNVPTWEVSLHHRFLNMGKIGHWSEKVFFWSQGVLSSECPLKTGFTVSSDDVS